MKVPAPTLDTWPEQAIRGDRIVGSRYTSRDFMEQEWEGMWTRVWLLLGREAGDPSGFVEEVSVKLGSKAFVAAGAVEVALYDLWGKAEGCSVTDFFGTLTLLNSSIFAIWAEIRRNTASLS